MEQKIKCPVCFHHVPGDGFCPRCTRLNISEKGLETLMDEFEAEQPGPDMRGNYSLQGRWSNMAYMVLAAILSVIGIKLGLDFTEHLPGAMKQFKEDGIVWRTFFYGTGSFLLLYVAAALGFNKTTVEINQNSLDVKRGPVWIPFSDSYRLEAGKIKRLDLFRAIDEGNSSELCEIMVVDENGESFDLFQFDDLGEAVAWYKIIKDLFQIKEIQQASIIRRKIRKVHPKAGTISLIYRIVLPGSFVLNLPAIFLTKEWRFDGGYWLTFGLFTMLIFLIMNFHHRKHLNVWDSHPLEADEEQVGPVFYAIVTVVYCFLLTPVAMLVYNFFLMQTRLPGNAFMIN